MQHALTIDVEEFFQVHALSGIIPVGSWDTFTPCIRQNVARVLDLLAEQKVSATFFCLGWIAERNRDLIRSIHAAGHEIASHGYLHQLISNQDPATFREDASRTKHILEDCIGEEVIGYRAPTYSITLKTLWALDILAELGFRYDSSIFPIHHDNYGIPNAPRFPHRLDGKPLVEFPISTVHVGSLNLPASGGGYFRLFPYPLTRFALKKIERGGSPFVFYIHPWELNPDTPRVDGASILSRFRTYAGISTSMLKLRRLLTDFRFTTARGVLMNLGLLE